MPASSGHVVVVGATSTAVRMLEEFAAAAVPAVVLDVGRPDAHLEELTGLDAELVQVRRVTRLDAEALGGADLARARCLVVLGADDVEVVQLALLVEELQPGLRMVLEMENPQLGRRLEPLLGECTVLSSAQLAAPSFVAAAIASSEVQTFEIGGRLVVAGPTDRVGGERLAVLTDSLLDQRTDLVLGTTVVGSSTGTVRPAGIVGAVRRTLDRRVRLVLLGLAILIVVSAAYFRLIGLDWWHAWYLALTQSTQTGVDNEVEGLSLVAKFGAVAIQLMGLVLSAGVTAVIVDLLVTSRLAALTGGVRGRPRHHVVVCGLGRIGTSVVARLVARGVAVVAIERDENGLGVRRARQLKVPVVIAEGTDSAALETAGLERADVLLALTDNDAANLEIALVAKEVNASIRVVTRLFDDDLAGRIERTLGLGPTRSVSAVAAPAFAAAALGRDIETVLPVGRRVLVFAEVALRRPGPVPAVAGAQVLAVRTTRGWNWSPQDVEADTGDLVAVAASRRGLRRFRAAVETRV